MHLSLPSSLLTLLTLTLTPVLSHPQPEPQPHSPSSSPSSSSPLTKRRNCDSAACVTYFSDSGCTDGLSLGSYRPDCTGNCFQYASFGSIRVEANLNTGVDCVAYSDYNCENQIGDSGNQHGRHCLDGLDGGAQSMRCYYGC